MNETTDNRRVTDIPFGDTGRILAIIYTVGYFAMVLTVMWKGIPSENKDVILQLIGILSIIQTTVVTFYFGGSKAAEVSQRHNAMARERAESAIQEIAKAPLAAAAAAGQPRDPQR